MPWFDAADASVRGASGSSGLGAPGADDIRTRGWWCAGLSDSTELHRAEGENRDDEERHEGSYAMHDINSSRTKARTLVTFRIGCCVSPSSGYTSHDICQLFPWDDGEGVTGILNRRCDLSYRVSWHAHPSSSGRMSAQP